MKRTFKVDAEGMTEVVQKWSSKKDKAQKIFDEIARRGLEVELTSIDGEPVITCDITDEELANVKTKAGV